MFTLHIINSKHSLVTEGGQRPLGMLEVLQSAWHWHWRTIEAGCWARGRDWWGAPWWGRPLPGVRWIQCDHPQHTPPPAWQLTGISSVRWGQEQLLIAINYVRWWLIPDMKEWSQSCNSNGRAVGVGGRSKLFDYEGISFFRAFLFDRFDILILEEEEKNRERYRKIFTATPPTFNIYEKYFSIECRLKSQRVWATDKDFDRKYFSVCCVRLSTHVDYKQVYMTFVLQLWDNGQLWYHTMIKITSLQANWQYFRFWVQLSSNECTFGHDQHFAAFAMLLFLCRIVARLPAVRQGRALSWRCSEDQLWRSRSRPPETVATGLRSAGIMWSPISAWPVRSRVVHWVKPAATAN